MKARNEEAEQEIQRLTKTVKIVEVEVKEETGPLEERIHLLENQKYDLQQENGSLNEQITVHNMRISELERERSQFVMDGDRMKNEFSL